MRERVDMFESMMRDMVREEGGRLLAEEQAWRGRVPKNVDAAAMSALAAPAAAKAAGAAGAGRVIRAAAIALAAAVAVTGGAYSLSPALRARTAALFGGTSGYTEQVSAKAPGDYSIPSPGEEYAVTDEARSDSVQYKWFTSAKREVLVEIAYALPEAVMGESVTVDGGVSGVYAEQGNTAGVVLQDGDVQIRITFSGAERDEVLAYAGTLLAENGR